MKELFHQEVEAIEALIRKAEGNTARIKLLALVKKRISFGREWEVAKLARRLHSPELGIKLLYPIVRSQGRVKRERTNEDILEYAACLIRLGLLSEAKTLLRSFTEQDKYAEALFFEAGIYIKEWEYQKAIPLLKKFLIHPDPTPYQKLVGKINLGLSCIFEKQFGSAKSLLSEAIEESNRHGYPLLHANALRLLGNLEVAKDNWEAAITFFEQSAFLLRASPGIDSFLCRKWIAISQYTLNPKSEEAQTAMTNAYREARSYRHWESVRDLDFYKAKRNRDSFLFRHLYFGTPFKSFRERLLSYWNPQTIEKEYYWRLGSSEANPVLINLLEGGKKLKVGQTVHRLFLVLCTDFYRTFNVPELFEKVFPQEFYHPKVSELRVRQAILKLRRFFSKEKLPLLLSEASGEYQLTAALPCNISVQLREEKTTEDPRLLLMKEKLPLHFSSHDVCALFQFSRRSATDLIQKNIEEGKILKVGAGRNIRYRFTTDEETPLKNTGS